MEGKDKENLEGLSQGRLRATESLEKEAHQGGDTMKRNRCQFMIDYHCNFFEHRCNVMANQAICDRYYVVKSEVDKIVERILRYQLQDDDPLMIKRDIEKLIEYARAGENL